MDINVMIVYYIKHQYYVNNVLNMEIILDIDIIKLVLMVIVIVVIKR